MRAYSPWNIFAWQQLGLKHQKAYYKLTTLLLVVVVRLAKKVLWWKSSNWKSTCKGIWISSAGRSNFTRYPGWDASLYHRDYLGIKITNTQLYTSGWREGVRGKFLTQEHTTKSLARAHKSWLLNLESSILVNHEATVPPRIVKNYKISRY